jgi:hypothetical protein
MTLIDTQEAIVRTAVMDWIPTASGKSFRPLRFEADGWSELMRLEPGSGVASHRHTGEVHAFNLTGSRQLLHTGEVIGPGAYVYEPAGIIDSWRAIGDEPCIVHLKIRGAVEYVNAGGEVTETADSASQRVAYLDFCRVHGVHPDEELLATAPRAGARLAT